MITINEPLYQELQMKLHLLIQERDALMGELAQICSQGDTEKYPHRITNRVERLKIIAHKVSRIGKRYNIIKAKGKYIIKTGPLETGKPFEIYYTDISTEDARRLVEMAFEHGVIELQIETIPVGEILEQKYQSQKAPK